MGEPEYMMTRQGQWTIFSLCSTACLSLSITNVTCHQVRTARTVTRSVCSSVRVATATACLASVSVQPASLGRPATCHVLARPGDPTVSTPVTARRRAPMAATPR